jgi:hypothetical protein
LQNNLNNEANENLSALTGFFEVFGLTFNENAFVSADNF